MECIYTKLCIYSYMFKLQSPSKYSLDAIQLPRFFFPQLKTFFELVNFDAFSGSAIFGLTSSTSVKMFPFEDSFHLVETKNKSLKLRSGE